MLHNALFEGSRLRFSASSRRRKRFELIEIAPGVFVHQGETALMSRDNLGGIANLGAIVGAEAVAVIDTGGSRAEGEAFLAALQQRRPSRSVMSSTLTSIRIISSGMLPSRTGRRLRRPQNLPRALATRGAHYIVLLPRDAWARCSTR